MTTINTPGPDVPPLADLANILERATAHRPSAIDEFARDQSALFDLVNASEPERDTWINGLTLAESRYVLSRLDTLAREHRARALTAENTAEWIRAGLAQIGREGTEKTANTTGMTAQG